MVLYKDYFDKDDSNSWYHYHKAEKNSITFTGDKEFYYNYRIKEFLFSTSKILFNRLESGFAKFGRLFIGSCPCEFIERYFSKYDFKTNTRTINCTRGGEKIPMKRIYFKFDNETGFPPLELNYLTKEQVTKTGVDIVNQYQQLVFIVSVEDDRVWATYQQVSYVKETGMIIP
jgi:hypothetical protein